MTNNEVTVKEKKRKRNNQPVPPEITEERERLAYELRIIQGKKLWEITKELNRQYPAYPVKSDQEAVRKMVLRVQDKYAARDKDKTDAVLAESSAMLDWVRNQSIAAIGTHGATNQPQDKPIYLKRVIETIDLKSKLFGVAAPKRHELTGKDGAPLGAPALDIATLGKYLSDGDLTILQQAAAIIERAQHAHNLAAIVEDNGD